MMLSFIHIDGSRTNPSLAYRSRERIQLFGSTFVGLEEIGIADVDAAPEANGLEREVDGLACLEAVAGGDSACLDVILLGWGSFLARSVSEVDGLVAGGDFVCFELDTCASMDDSACLDAIMLGCGSLLAGSKREVDGLAAGGDFICLELDACASMDDSAAIMLGWGSF